MKYLIWASPRTGSNLLCNLLHRTGVAGIKDYVNCGFPLGSLGEIHPNQFQAKLTEYELSQTTANGVFGCKLSWEGLLSLERMIGLRPIIKWLSTVDRHIYLTREDVVAQAVSFYIAKNRSYYSTLKTDGREHVEDTPPYNFDAIALEYMRLRTYDVQIRTFLFNYNVPHFSVSYERLTYDAHAMHVILTDVLDYLGLPKHTDPITPQIRKQTNPAKKAYIQRFRVERQMREPL